MTLKKCTKCGHEKPAEGFYKNVSAKDGLNSQCKQCLNVAIKKWQSQNRQRINEKRAVWREENKAKEVAAVTIWQKNNPDKVRKATKKWKQANRTKLILLNANRRSSKKLATPKWSESDKIAVLYRKAAELGMEVDHVVPLKSSLVCGLHCWHNLQLLDRSINISKGNRHWPDMP